MNASFASQAKGRFGLRLVRQARMPQKVCVMKEEDRSRLESLKERLSKEDLLFGMITRTELARRSGGMFTRKTLANHDALGIGPGRGRKNSRGQVAYYIEDVLAYVDRQWQSWK